MAETDWQQIAQEHAEQAARLEAENAEMRMTIAALEKKVADLQARRGRNPRNSSMPPSVEDYEDLAWLAARVLKPGRLAGVYCGHVHLDEELRLLEQGGLSYIWHGVNLLNGRHTKIRGRMVNERHRSVLLFSAGPYQPRKRIHDTFIAHGRGGPETRPLHPWQQALGPVTGRVQMTTEAGELVFDPFLGSGTTAVAAIGAGRRFLGGDLEAGNVATAQDSLEEVAGDAASSDGG